MPSSSPWRLGARTLALCTLSLLFPVAVYAAQAAAPVAPASPWWPPSPLEVAIAWPIVTGICSLTYTKLDANTRIHAVFAFLASVGLDLPALGASITKAVTGRYSLGAKARAASIASSCLVLVALAVLCAGCLDAPIVPVTAANAQQVSQCQGAASLHNGFVFGDYTLGAAGAAVGVVGAALPSSNASGKTDLAITGAALAAVAAGGAGLAALESHAYAADKCSTLIEPLFDKHAPRAEGAVQP